MATFTGYTCDTAQSLQLDAGAYFKNFDVAVDTYESAMKAGKCLGATKGGGSFNAVPTSRTIEIDGMPGGAKGSTVYDSWVVTITANIVEMRPETLKDALGTGVITEENDKFYKIRARNQVELEDYIDNITWVGRISGSREPVIFQIYNALSTTGIALTTADKSEGVLAVTFKATSDPCGKPDEVDYAPFAIFYPKVMAKVIVSPVFNNSTSITGTGIEGATVHVTGGTIPANATATVAAGSTFTITITAQEAGTELLVWQEKDNRSSLPVKIYVQLQEVAG